VKEQCQYVRPLTWTWCTKWLLAIRIGSPFSSSALFLRAFQSCLGAVKICFWFVFLVLCPPWPKAAAASCHACTATHKGNFTLTATAASSCLFLRPCCCLPRTRVCQPCPLQEQWQNPTWNQSKTQATSAFASQNDGSVGNQQSRERLPASSSWSSSRLMSCLL
jgi:hypothetical protein